MDDNTYTTGHLRVSYACMRAREVEKEIRERVYVAKGIDGLFYLAPAMPYLGEWYDSDGIKHGE